MPDLDLTLEASNTGGITTTTEAPMPDLKTIGLSPKAVAAFLFPVLAALVVAVVAWIDGDVFDISGIKFAIGGVLTGGLALLGAYLGHPGDVQPK